MTPPTSGPIEVIAHRGAGQGDVRPASPPENTLPALREGWREADACEIDVQLSRDGAAVVFHDDTLARTTNATGNLTDRTLAELRELDAGAWKGPAWVGVRVPTFAEVLAALPAGKRLYVELKFGPAVVPPVAAVVAAWGGPAAQLVFISFDVDTIRAARAAFPRSRCYLLVNFVADDASGGWRVQYAEGPAFRGITLPADAAGQDALVARVREAGLDGIDSSFLVPGQLLRRLADAGLDAVMWTVNDPELAVDVARLGVRHVTTDTPGPVRAALEAAGFETGPGAFG